MLPAALLVAGGKVHLRKVTLAQGLLLCNAFVPGVPQVECAPQTFCDFLPQTAAATKRQGQGSITASRQTAQGHRLAACS